MKPAPFKNSSSGRCLRTLENYWAYIPNPLPPPVQYDDEIVRMLSDADTGANTMHGSLR